MQTDGASAPPLIGKALILKQPRHEGQHLCQTVDKHGPRFLSKPFKVVGSTPIHLDSSF
jgi:hypothetical protein